MRYLEKLSVPLRLVTLALVLVTLLFGGVMFVSAMYTDSIVAGTQIGSLSVGGLSPEGASARVQERLDALSLNGLAVQVQDQYEMIQPESVGLDVNIQQAVEEAFEVGHRGSWWLQARERTAALWSPKMIVAPVSYDHRLLDDQIDSLGQLSSVARRDLRLSVSGTTVTLLTDTRPGKVVDRVQTLRVLDEQLRTLRIDPVRVELLDDVPRATMSSAQKALDAATRMSAQSLALVYEDFQLNVSRVILASWLKNDYAYDRLLVGLDRKAIAQHVTQVAERLNVAPVGAKVETEEGLITGFTPPEYGRAVEEDETVALIMEALRERGDGAGSASRVIIPIRQSRPPEVSLGDGAGISELIGKATTLFTGSPKNRVWNITNGARFLSGIVVAPGEEFSTLEELGTIDNTTGYLPELVIRGDRTLPEYGGGLCQVSTTLFRAIMDAGLPVTDRRNHSRRVGYYERDEHGQYIGPGLDATIYDNAPDLKFLNDTSNSILVISYVHSTKITFELYGTRDERSSQIIGPSVLTEVDPGEPVYVETDELAPGVVKQVEWAQPGGSTVATYIITYADGTTNEQEFKSYYRKWPDRFLVGIDPHVPPIPEGTPVE